MVLVDLVMGIIDGIISIRFIFYIFIFVSLNVGCDPLDFSFLKNFLSSAIQLNLGLACEIFTFFATLKSILKILFITMIISLPFKLFKLYAI